ncbi:uncharacterized protein [Spinacia oleracea]|uniref:Uncharacterized protein n=1 Tax=Spinacia oleracea TaxID=3562 RepID=A0ABM3R4W4_SPIOL|nr:uncharacterized protein LOC130465826 [Spinacia oleracea]
MGTKTLNLLYFCLPCIVSQELERRWECEVYGRTYSSEGCLHHAYKLMLNASRLLVNFQAEVVLFSMYISCTVSFFLLLIFSRIPTMINQNMQNREENSPIATFHAMVVFLPCFRWGDEVPPELLLQVGKGYPQRPVLLENLEGGKVSNRVVSGIIPEIQIDHCMKNPYPSRKKDCRKMVVREDP